MALSAVVRNMPKWASGAFLLMTLFGCSGTNSSSSSTVIRAVDTIETGTAAFTYELSTATSSTSLGTLSYGGSSSYTAASAGTNEVTATLSGGSTATSSATITSGDYYTAVLFGKYSAANPSLIVYQDDRTAPASGNARLRIIDAASDLNAIDVSGYGVVSPTTLASDISYENTGASYSDITAGAYSFSAYPTGTTTSNYLGSNSYTFNAGYYYTLFITETASGAYSTFVTTDTK